MSIFNFSDYREYIQDYVQNLPKKGWGFASKMSVAIDIQPALFSQVLSGEKDLTLEMGFKFAKYISLNDIETEYLMELLQLARAGSEELKAHYTQRVAKLKHEGGKLKNHLTDGKIMALEEKVEFYSNFLYSAIRIYSSIGDGKSPEEIQKHFQVPSPFLKSILEFLESHGLCERLGNRYRLGQQRTVAEKGTPMYFKHSTNWRLQAIQKMELNRKSDLFITSPMSLSIEDQKIIHNQIIEFVKNFSERVKNSDSEETVCLNIDFFNF
jgi:uncharacterized protein (TIGR02147 family)